MTLVKTVRDEKNLKALHMAAKARLHERMATLGPRHPLTVEATLESIRIRNLYSKDED
jgi:hypothetical protein